MQERKNAAPDAQKVFETIAQIVTRRGEGNVRLISIKSIQQERKAG